MKPFLKARWQYLVMINYEVEPDILKSYIPNGTELDSFDGKTFLSVVAFQFLDTRVRGVVIPFHRDFEEINLRFYVRRSVGGEIRRGVVFIREIVPRAAIAFIAKRVYGENYSAMPTRSTIVLPTNNSSCPEAVRYDWKFKGDWNSISVRATGQAFYPLGNSVEEFITEHYWGYTKHNNETTSEYHVEHPRWKIWNVVSLTSQINGEGLYGSKLGSAIQGKPHSSFLAEGSEVSVSNRINY